MKSSYSRKVYFSEVNEKKIMPLAEIINYMQDSSAMQGEEIGKGLDYRKERQEGWIINYWQINIKDSIKYMDELKVSTWISSYRGGIWTRDYLIEKDNKYNESNSSFGIAEAKGIWVLYDFKNNKLTVPEKEEINLYGIENGLELKKYGRRIKPGENYEKIWTEDVLPYQIDVNHHMNNSWYIEMLEGELYNRDREFISGFTGTLRIEYKKSAMLGDTINCFESVCEDRRVYELRSDTDEVYAMIEFRSSEENAND